MAVDLGEALQINSGTGIKKYETVSDLLSIILPNVYVIAGLILFFLLIAGGFVIMTSGDNPEKQSKGAKAITASIIGFIVIFASYWIIQIIETVFGFSILNPGI